MAKQQKHQSIAKTLMMLYQHQIKKLILTQAKLNHSKMKKLKHLDISI